MAEKRQGTRRETELSRAGQSGRGSAVGAEQSPFPADGVWSGGEAKPNRRCFAWLRPQGDAKGRLEPAHPPGRPWGAGRARRPPPPGSRGGGTLLAGQTRVFWPGPVKAARAAPDLLPQTHTPPAARPPSPGLASFVSRLAHTVVELKPNLSPLQLGFPDPAAGFEAAGPTPPGGGADRVPSVGSSAPCPVPLRAQSQFLSLTTSAPLSARQLATARTRGYCPGGGHGPGVTLCCRARPRSRRVPAGSCERAVGGVRVQERCRCVGVRACGSCGMSHSHREKGIPKQGGLGEGPQLKKS